MIEVDDTKSNAGETAPAPRGDEHALARDDERAAPRSDERALARDDERAATLGDERTAARDDARAAAWGDERAAASRGAAFELTNAGDAPPASSAGGSSGVDAAPGTDAPETQPAPYIDSLVLQPDFQAGDRSHYHVAELVAYHDRKFVDADYKAILRRLPSLAERGRELEDLRGGRAGKVEIIERLLASPEARSSGRGGRVEGLPSPLMRRLSRVPVLGYALRLVRALARLPVSMQHQQQFEIYALAQQQRIVDYINQRMGRIARAGASSGGAPLPFYAFSQHGDGPEHHDDVAETMAMFSDALVELSNSHADLQARTQTQVEQAQAALADLTAAITAQQQLAETLRREQQLAADAQQEFLIQEQRVIVETQQAVLAELREELRELSARQQRARDEFDAEVSRLRSLEAAARGNFSGQA